jgi:hypothetical protein
MAGSLQGLPNFPTFGLQPSATQVALSTNYITNFDFLNQYLPDTYEKEFERYGNRSVSSFLRMVGAEMPCEMTWLLLVVFQQALLLLKTSLQQ